MNKSLLTIFLLLLCFHFLNAHPPWGMVVDQDRNVYFADILHHGRGALWKWNSSEGLKLLQSDFHAHNVVMTPEGCIGSAHGENHHAFITFCGSTLDTVAYSDSHTEFNGGNCTMTPSGDIIFGVDHHLWRWTEKGRVKLSDHYFEWNQLIYAAPDGLIYATDIGKLNGCLVKIYPDGRDTIIARDLIAKLDRPRDKHNDILQGVTQGCDGHLYVSELAGRRILKILSDGSSRLFYQSPDHWMPTAVDFFAGDAYILEYKFDRGWQGPRLVMVEEDGHIKTLWTYGESPDQGLTIPGDAKRGPAPTLWVIFLLATLIVVLSFLTFNRKQRRIRQWSTTLP